MIAAPLGPIGGLRLRLQSALRAAPDLMSPTARRPRLGNVVEVEARDDSRWKDSAQCIQGPVEGVS